MLRMQGKTLRNAMGRHFGRMIMKRIMSQEGNHEVLKRDLNHFRKFRHIGYGQPTFSNLHISVITKRYITHGFPTQFQGSQFCGCWTFFPNLKASKIQELITAGSQCGQALRTFPLIFPIAIFFLKNEVLILTF